MTLREFFARLRVALLRRKKAPEPPPVPKPEPSKAEVKQPGPVTQSLVTANPADKPVGKPGRNEEGRLDEALEETFPASDPVSVHIE